MWQINFLLNKLINTLTTRHHEWFTHILHTRLSKRFLFWWVKPFIHWLPARLTPQTLFGLHLLLCVLPEGGACFLIVFLKGRDTTEWIVTVTHQVVTELSFSRITQDVRAFAYELCFKVWVFIQQFTLLFQSEEVSKKVCVRTMENKIEVRKVGQ